MTHEQIKALLKKMLEEEGAKNLAKRLGVTRQNIWAVMVGKWSTGGKLLKALGLETKVTFKVVSPHLQRPQMRMKARERRAFLHAQQEAKRISRQAVKEGKLIDLKNKDVLCVDCKERRATDYEHRDYSKPLVVDPVCRKCNMKRGPAKF